MFSTEFEGYSKNEVDRYISQLKAEYEKTLMEEKLKVLEAERKVLEYKNKQKNIMNALESYKKEEAEGNRNIEILRGEQLRMVYSNLRNFLEELNSRYPGILLNNNYNVIIIDNLSNSSIEVLEKIEKITSKKPKFYKIGNKIWKTNL